MFESDWVDAYFEHGIDITNRRVFIDDNIEKCSNSAIKGLYLMETQSKKEPIEIFLNSYGGELLEAMAIHDIMNTIQCPIHTFGFGKCQSAATVILANGEPGHRWVSPSCRFMYHDLSYGVQGKRTEIKYESKEAEAIFKCWTDALISTSNKDKRWWTSKAKMNGDYFFSSDEAIDIGIADNIWVEK